jgi:hypothetical protein
MEEMSHLTPYHCVMCGATWCGGVMSRGATWCDVRCDVVWCGATWYGGGGDMVWFVVVV